MMQQMMYISGVKRKKQRSFQQNYVEVIIINIDKYWIQMMLQMISLETEFITHLHIMSNGKDILLRSWIK